MDRRVLAINNWVTTRYFKKGDLATYFRYLNYFIQKDIEIAPTIMVSKPTKMRRTADVILCFGVDEARAKSKIGAERLLLSCGWSDKHEITKLVERDEILSCMKKKNGIEELYRNISSYLVSITDENVEMRGVRRQ